MKNIRSSKSQGGFIGILILIAVAYVILVPAFFLIAGLWASGYDAEKEAVERAQYSDLEWIQKEGYDAAQSRYCRKDPTRQYDTFSCTDTIEEWSKTPSAKKVILDGLHRNAYNKWKTDNVYYIIQPSNGFEVVKYPSMSKVPCTYEYLNKTYNCDKN